MKKKLLTAFFAVVLTALSLYAQNKTEGSAPVPAPLPSAPAPVVSPEKTATSVVAPEPAPAAKKSVSPRKFGPGITKIPKSESVESLGVSSSRMLTAMLIVIAAMVFFFWLLKKLNSRLSSVDKESALRIKSRVQLDTKNSVVLIGVYEQEFLVGSGTNGVTLISKFSSIEDEPGLTEEEIPPGNRDNDVKNDIKDVSFTEKLLKLGAAPVESSSLKKINGDK